MLKSQNTTEITTLIKDYSDDKTFEKKKRIGIAREKLKKFS